MKKLLLLLLLSVLIIGSEKNVYATSTGGGGASFYNCDCGGLGIEYWECDKDIYFNCLLIHHNDNGTIVDRHASHPKLLPEYESYLVMRVQTDASGEKEIYPSRIVISDKSYYEEYTDNNGKFRSINFSDYNSTLWGTANGKNFCLDTNYAFMTLDENDSYEVLWTCDWQYIIESDDSLNDITTLAKYLCGEEGVEIPESVTTVIPLPVYDLESPLDIKINTGSATVNVEADSYTNIKSGTATLIPHKIWWSQSNIDLTGYETEFYIKEFGRCRKSIFSPWQDCNTGWIYDGSHVTAKYCNNNLKWHEFRCWESSSLKEIAITQLEDDNPTVEFNSCDFMIRNKKEDENGQMHYSNWVYVNTYDDGTYSVYEMVQDYDITEDSDETGNINTDSTIYDDEIIHVDDSDTSIGVGGIDNAGTFLTVLKDLANSIKTFPDFFGEVFSFLPSWILTSIGILFIIVLVCAIF